MNYSKFYTPPQIAEYLIGLLNIKTPNKVIDICCGSCNLLNAAKERWGNTKLFGVDVMNCNNSKIQFYCSDGRKFAMESEEKFPLVVANPPFDKVEELKQYPELYLKIKNSIVTNRLEIEMLYANLSLLQYEGILVIILPSSFITAERYKKYRAFLANNYQVLSIYELPLDTFGAKRIKTHALIIKNKVPSNYKTYSYQIIYNNNNYELCGKVNISQKSMKTGEWDRAFTQIKHNDVNFVCKRGNISSNMFSDDGQEVLHTARLNDKWKPSIRHTKCNIKNPVYAEKGDIIISRIGHSAGSFCVYDGGKKPISDCLYVIKDEFGAIAKVLENKHYSIPLRGVATPYITANDFLKWYSSIYIRDEQTTK